MYINREISWLEFDRRVLEQAAREDLPLLERLKFLAISASNLDEFYQVRVGGLQLMQRSGKILQDAAGQTPEEQLKNIRARAQEIVQRQYELMNTLLLPLMREAGVAPVPLENLSEAQLSSLGTLFMQQVAPLLTPLALEKERTITLPNLSLALGVELAGKDADADKSRLVVVALPEALPRRVHAACLEEDRYVLLEELSAHFIGMLFEGERILHCTPLRVTRNGDITVQEEEGTDFAWEMSQVLVARKFSDCVRMELPGDVDDAFARRLAQQIGAEEETICHLPGYLRLSDFGRMAEEPGHERLKIVPWEPNPPEGVDPSLSMFDNISRGDILINTPFESYEPVVKLAEEAAEDPNVLAIKQLLYRTANNSRFITALCRAAERGKQVTALVELKARFDEGHNLSQAERLQRAGVQVIYGVKGFKTHAKAMLIVRRENGVLKRYCHIGTGNYNEDTARIYGDLSLLTCEETMGADISQFFNCVTGLTQMRRFRRLYPSPAFMKERLLELVRAETQRARRGETARILAKMNSLNDPDMMEALEEASRAGVEIRLNVRGICCWVPSTEEGRRHTRIVSIVDRYLEHARILCFHNGGDELVFITSADWMSRNLDRRVELLAPVEDKRLARRAVEILHACMRDNVQASVILPDGSSAPVVPGPDEPPFRMQEHLQQQARKRARASGKNSRTVLVPHKPKNNPAVWRVLRRDSGATPNSPVAARASRSGSSSASPRRSWLFFFCLQSTRSSIFLYISTSRQSIWISP